jgi:hypothetical protein
MNVLEMFIFDSTSYLFFSILKLNAYFKRNTRMDCISEIYLDLLWAQKTQTSEIKKGSGIASRESYVHPGPSRTYIELVLILLCISIV